MVDFKYSVDILLVEDNLNDAELVSRALRVNNLAINIFHVEDGSAALDVLFHKGEYEKRRSYNTLKLILLDIKLPKINGLEVLKLIKEDNRTKHIPVVMLTSSGEVADIELAYDLGANGFVVKPVDAVKLSHHIKGLAMYWLRINLIRNVKENSTVSKN